MDATQRKIIFAKGQLLLKQPEWGSLVEQLLSLKPYQDANDPNTAKKAVVLWAHQGRDAKSFLEIIEKSKQQGRSKFAFAIGMAKKGIDERLWKAYSA